VTTDAGGKILLVDSDGAVQDLLGRVFQQEGYQVIRCQDGASALPLCLAERPGIVILEATFPLGSGFAICREIRMTAALAETPIIFLTSLQSAEDRVQGLDAGANDYVTKPFSVRELIARVKANLRGRPGGNGTLYAGPVELDTSRCRVRLDGVEVPVTGMELRLLEYFMRNPGHVMSRKRLLNAVWPPGERAHERTVDVHVTRLRAKLRLSPAVGVYFRSVRGFGYSLEVPAP
jgi:two-component system alkaline phosphatase synthesis response regulator PhoP